MPESVAAVVVTYNRSRLLLECLAALLEQSRPLDRIVLIDNATTDDTVAALRARGYLDHALIDYTRLPTNTGGAGGFHEGIRRAAELGVDWVWIMDDDAEPFPDALERLQTGFARSGTAAVANLTLDLDGHPQLEHRGWLRLCGLTTRAHRPIDQASLTRHTDVSFCSFVGLAIRRTAIERIGLPKRELFIKGDDLEYCIRLATVGPILLVPESKIRHKDGMSAHYEAKSRFGLTSQRVPLNKLWLSYFSVRNLIWLRLHHCGAPVAAIYSLEQLLRRACGILLFDSERLVRLRFYFSAIADAWRDLFDNDKPKKLTRLPQRSDVTGRNPVT
jgi:rhamnopyranosyl-N-acetylglucosaminyl-diphospho-decaprenol beta-1,3/1,4-galactofuranosyltransferase